jgi:hypothetical protein
LRSFQRDALLHLIDRAGDTSWQFDPDRPPRCSRERSRVHGTRLFDVLDPDQEAPAEGWTRVRSAIAICNSGCPVVAECLAYALDPVHSVEGVWGGRYFGGSDPLAAHRGVRASFLPPEPGSHGRRAVQV